MSKHGSRKHWRSSIAMYFGIYFVFIFILYDIFVFTPKYIAVKVNGHNRQSQNILKTAIKYRINQELKYLYIKKQKLNEQLYHLYLNCAKNLQNSWLYIQANIDKKLQEYNEKGYDNLNRKLDDLQKKKQPYNGNNSHQNLRSYWHFICHSKHLLRDKLF
jgi:hypothetical protein